MERIKEIWNQLETDKSDIAGLFKIRFSETSPCNVYLGIKSPEQTRILIISAPFLIGKNFSFKYEFRGLKFEKIYDPGDKNSILLNLVLIDRHLQDIFDSLVLDILSYILEENDIRVILKNYTNRLVKWQSLFDKYNKAGLSNEEQRGLYGELYFLRYLLGNESKHDHIVDSWVGPEKQLQDFQDGSWAVEVKTTHGNNHQKIHINSERQLDTTNIDTLYLCHLSLDVLQNSGETLNQIVRSIRDLLAPNAFSFILFNTKLIEAGYYDSHYPYYESKGYFIRQKIFYLVEKEFPRIEEKDICYGVGDVKYSIIVSNCTDYIKSEKEVFDKINLL